MNWVYVKTALRFPNPVCDLGKEFFTCYEGKAGLKLTDLSCFFPLSARIIGISHDSPREKDL